MCPDLCHERKRQVRETERSGEGPPGQRNNVKKDTEIKTDCNSTLEHN